MKLLIKIKNKKYPIYIGKNNCFYVKSFLKKNNIISKNILIVYDKNIPKAIINKIKKNLASKQVLFLKYLFNEKNKNMQTVEKILNVLQKSNFNRDDSIISVGGGIAGDVCGFVASIYKRGINFVNIPSTLLSQVDSSIGGKTGINDISGKNMIGTFYHPNFVIADTIFLKSLPRRELICGYSEILKHSLIKSKKLFYFLKNNYEKILNLDQNYLGKAMLISCKIKKRIIEKDEKEENLRKILNFGHTFAHAFEATLGYSKKLNHGEAVLLGMFAASKFSFKNGLLPKSDFEEIQNHLSNLNFVNFKKYFRKNKTLKILKFMINDKKNKSKKINLILLNRISKPVLNKEFNKKVIKEFIDELID